MSFMDNFNPDFDDAGPLATPSDAVREYAYNVGAQHPDRAWILSQYDSWERNPYFRGPACHRDIHPESGDGGEFEFEIHQDCKGNDCKGKFYGPIAKALSVVTLDSSNFDDIPF